MPASAENPRTPERAEQLIATISCRLSAESPRATHHLEHTIDSERKIDIFVEVALRNTNGPAKPLPQTAASGPATGNTNGNASRTNKPAPPRHPRKKSARLKPHRKQATAQPPTPTGKEPERQLTLQLVPQLALPPLPDWSFIDNEPEEGVTAAATEESVDRESDEAEGGTEFLESALGDPTNDSIKESTEESDFGLQPAMAAGVTSRSSDNGDGNGVRIRTKVLVIDDDPVMRRLLTMGLGSHSYECMTAENGKVAQDLVSVFQPDLILVDLLMPVMDGLSFLQWLRRTARDSTAAIVLTNVSDLRIQQEARESGADAVLCKPLNLGKLLEEMRRLVPA